MYLSINMKILDIISIIGTLVTIYGAYLAIEAKKSAKKSELKALEAKTQAEQARDLVIHKQQTTSLVTLLNETKRVQKVFFKYSNLNINRSIEGIDFNKDAEELQNIITVFNESRGIIDDQTELESQKTYNNLNELHNKFCAATNKTARKESGHQIRLDLDDIIFKVQKVIENRNYQIN